MNDENRNPGSQRQQPQQGNTGAGSRQQEQQGGTRQPGEMERDDDRNRNR